MPGKNNIKTVVLFGDSLFGRFGKHLMTQLETATGGTIVNNCAAGGLNSQDGVKRASMIAKMQPDYVVLSFGANDAAPWKQQVSEVAFASNLKVIIKSFASSKVILFLCPPANDLGDDEIKQFNKLLIQYNEIAKRIAIENDAQYIDSPNIYGELLKNGNNYHMGDGIHLNEDGYKVFIDQVAPLMRS